MTNILITGGTGSFGQTYIRQALQNPELDRLVVYSRDELKQHHMRADGLTDPRLRYFIGDVRDRDRLRRAMHTINTVIHAAALKQVDTAEYNPLEAKKTNIDGTANVIDAALDADIQKVMLLSSDKAVDPTNLYGATKLVAEKLVVDANAYTGDSGPRFAAVRYGNVLGSRGSVLHTFQTQHAAGQPLTITDPHMTRFWLTLQQAARFVTDCLDTMTGGEIFIPKLEAATISDLAHAVSDNDTVIVGARPGEKLHETLISQHETGRTIDKGWCYIITPLTPFTDTRWEGDPGPSIPYSSDTATRLTASDLRRLIHAAENIGANAA